MTAESLSARNGGSVGPLLGYWLSLLVNIRSLYSFLFNHPGTCFLVFNLWNQSLKKL